MTNLVVPAFVWNGAPTHEISALIGIPSQSKIVTGSTTGTLCIWGTNFQENKIEPLFILSGQDRSPVVGLAVTKHELIEAVVSVTEDGAVAISNLIDGQCIGYALPGTLEQPTCIQMLNKRYLVSAGKSCMLEILDLVTRKVIRRIGGHQSWILSIMKCSIGDTPVLATLTKGALRFYHSNVLFGRDTDGSCLPIQQVMIEKLEGHAIDISLGGDLLLLVGKTQFSIYLIKGSRLLLEHTIDDSEGIETGKWLKENDMLIIWTKSYKGHIFQLTNTATDGMISPRKSHSQPSIPSTLSGHYSLVFVQVIEMSAQLKMSDIKAWCGDNKIIAGTGDGFLEVWKIPKFENDFESGSFGMRGSISEDGLSDSFKIGEAFDETEKRKRKRTVVNSANFVVTSIRCLLSSFWENKKMNSVTAICLIEDSFTLLEGLKNGNIVSRMLPFDSAPKTWKIHDAPVTCILVLNVSVSKRDVRKYLITGSEDFYVKVWDLDTQELLARFGSHSGPVTNLFVAGGDSLTLGKIWKNRLFSIAKDNCVILYQIDSNSRILHVYGPHPDEIVDVKWVVQQDYLIVRCIDKSVSIWEIDSGRLEQRIYGEVADDIYNNAAVLLEYQKQAKNQQMYKKALTGIVLDSNVMGKNAPTLAIVFNIRQWYFELQQNYSRTKGRLSASGNNIEHNGNEESYDIQHEEICSIPSFKAFSCLIPWHFDDELDHIVRSELLLKPPNPPLTFGLVGHTARFSIMVPDKHDDSKGRYTDRRWTTSETMTGLHTLATACLSKALWSIGKNPNACIQVQTYVISEVPQRYLNFVNPSLSFLARYWHDQKDDVMETARSIFNTVIDRLGAEERLELGKYWASFLSLGSESDNKSKSLAVLVLGILGCEKPDSLTPEISQNVTTAILDILYYETNVQLKISAVELFGKGFSLWSKYIKNPSQVIIKLFKLSISQDSKALQSCSSHALILIGSTEPKQFLNAITTKEGVQSELSPTEHSYVLGAVGSLVKKRPVCLMSYLPQLAESIIRNLDPHVPYLRNACFKSATTLIHELVKKYPMIDFHQDSQRLVVGDSAGPILIYDLTSATRFYMLEGTSPISAVCFSKNGKILASYSIDEGIVKLWRQSNSFFSLLGSSMTCNSVVRVSVPQQPLTPTMLLETIKFQSNDKHFMLSVDQNTLTIPYSKAS